MDVFKLQKINSLANDLRKHNFAVSSDEAFAQAEQVYDEQQGAVEGETVTVQKPSQDLLAQHQFRLMLEQNNRKYEQEISLLRSALTALAQDLERVKDELRKVNEAHPRPKERQEPLKTEPKEVHPRQGNFTPGDVDIQKMFYFGSKR